jgi:hypothetical protein
MKMRYDPVLDNFDTTMLGEAMGNVPYAGGYY